MSEERYYRKKYFSEKLKKDLEYFYDHGSLRRGWSGRFLVYGISDGGKDAKAYFLTMLVEVLLFLIVIGTFAAIFVAIRAVLGIDEKIGSVYEIVLFLGGFVLFFLTYAVLMPRLIDMGAFRKVLDVILLRKIT